jgi:hypothetical protein
MTLDTSGWTIDQFRDAYRRGASVIDVVEAALSHCRLPS